MQVHRSWRVYLLAALFLNLLLFAYLAFQQHFQSTADSNGPFQPRIRDNKQSFESVDSFTNDITVILRDFEDFDNSLVQTVGELQNVLGRVKVLIIGDNLPYPPLELDKEWNCEIVSLQSNMLLNYSTNRAVHLIKTKYLVVLPDGAVFKHLSQVKSATYLLGGNGQTKAVALGIGKDPLRCLSLDVDLKRWQLTMQNRNSSSISCDMFVGDHALIMLTSDFFSLAEPFARPFSHCFYVQASLHRWKIRYIQRLQLSRVIGLFSDPHNKWKHKHLDEERLSIFYRQAGIKLIVHPDGRSEYHGCNKITSRCFGTIVSDMPDYLYYGKWTPPCCLKALRETARHVFGIFDKENVRYWLEGGSLLGAARNGDIIPWDYDVDIGIYREDILKSSHLKDAVEKAFVDELGFVWEKAEDGEFFRVQYSEQNHLHVDIHPFYSRNGTMTKNTWFKTHRQDTEFPEHFLTPLTKLTFAGIMANAPNNVKAFLEYKFGYGVIEQPRYPNFKKVQI